MPLPLKIADLIPALGLIPHPEGGFFVETYRSGSLPMTTKGQTGLDCNEPQKNLVSAHGRGKNREDGEDRRNALTSIYWVPTHASPNLLFAKNESDHIHYYQGGCAFKYYLFNPKNGEMKTETLGPDLHEGQKMQIAVPGEIWKCGKLLKDEDCNGYEYTLIGEAVAPGFDFHDFAWITENELRDKCKNANHVKTLMAFLHESAKKIVDENRVVDAAAEFYEENDVQQKRANERANKS